MPTSEPLSSSPSGPDRPCTVHLRVIGGPRISEIALLRAEVHRRERDVEVLRAAMTEVLGRFVELARDGDAHDAPRVDPEPAPPAAPAPPTAPAAPAAPVAEAPPAAPTCTAQALAARPHGSAGRTPPVAETAAVPPRRAPVAPEELAALAEITVTSEIVARARPGRAPLLSVVLVTATWPSTIDAAVDSLRGQSYEAWELVVVDDRRPLPPPPPLAHCDGRIRVIAGPGRGGIAAHNRALEAVQGDLVAYLADDARMAPGWLAALVWANDQWPGTDVFTGASLTLSVDAGLDASADLVELRRDGRIGLAPDPTSSDAGWLAHRRDLGPARFDQRPDGFDERPDGGPSPSVRALTTSTRVRRLAALATLVVGDVAGATPAASPRQPPTGGLPPLGGHGLLRSTEVRAARH